MHPSAHIYLNAHARGLQLPPQIETLLGNKARNNMRGRLQAFAGTQQEATYRLLNRDIGDPQSFNAFLWRALRMEVSRHFKLMPGFFPADMPESDIEQWITREVDESWDDLIEEAHTIANVEELPYELAAAIEYAIEGIQEVAEVTQELIEDQIDVEDDLVHEEEREVAHDRRQEARQRVRQQREQRNEVEDMSFDD